MKKKKTQFFVIPTKKLLSQIGWSLGMYEIIWQTKQMNRLSGKKPLYAHWGFQLGAFWIFLVGSIATMFALPTFIDDARLAAEVDTLVFYGLVLAFVSYVVLCGAAVARAVAKELEVPFSRLDILSSVRLQGIINQRAGVEDEQLSKDVRSSNLSNLGVIAVLIVLACFAYGYIVADTEKFYVGMETDVRLYAEYEKCTADLDEKYPQEEIPEDVFDEYSKEFDTCEEVYQEYLKPKY